LGKTAAVDQGSVYKTLMTALSPLLLTVLCLLFSHPVFAEEWRHGLSFFGDLKYPANFSHFEYVNPQAPKMGEMVMPALGNFDTLNPYIRKGRKASGMTYQPMARVLILERLAFKADDEPSSQYGWLAEEIMLADDYSWVRFRLRKQARWHDGRPITTKDVLFTFDKIKSVGSPLLKANFYLVSHAEIINDREIKFFIPGATSPKSAQIIAAMYVAPEHYWRDRDFEKSTMEVPLGSGPYKITKIEPGRKEVYELVDDYWAKDIPVMKGRHNIRRIVYDHFTNEQVILEAHKAGVTDAFLEGVSKRWAKEYDFPGYRSGLFVKDLISTERPFGMQQGVMFNMRLEKFQDVRVREALALVYDFEWSNKILYHGFYQRNDSFFENSDLAQAGLPSEAELELLEPFRGQVPERVFTEHYKPTVTTGGYSREPLLKAARLLKQAGYEVRNNVLINGTTGAPFTIDLVVLSVYQERGITPYIHRLKRLGIHARVRTIEVSQFINRVGKFDFEGTIRTYAQTMTPGNELKNYWGSAAADRQYSRNNSGIKDPVVDQLIEKIIAARSRDQLIAATRALDRVLLWNFYAVPGFFPPGYRYGYWDKYKKPEIQARFRSGFFDTWWYSEEKAQRVEEGMRNMLNDDSMGED